MVYRHFDVAVLERQMLGRIVDARRCDDPIDVFPFHFLDLLLVLDAFVDFDFERIFVYCECLHVRVWHLGANRGLVCDKQNRRVEAGWDACQTSSYWQSVCTIVPARGKRMYSLQSRANAKRLRRDQ